MGIQIGEKFGRLTVTACAERRSYFICLCECGNQKEVRKDHLKYRKIVSCGCYKNATASKRAHVMHEANTTHGLSKSSIYTTWRAMIQRCENQNTKHYARYGGRGIAVCERWHDFENFLVDMGEKPPRTTLERKNNDLGYSPENCVWATRKEQQNNRATCRYVTWNGEIKTVMEWSNHTGIHHNTISQRLDRGLPLDEVFSKEKRRNLSGLVLGAKASQKARLSITHCSRGHEYTPENTYHNGIQRRCRTCHNEQERARNAAKRST